MDVFDKSCLILKQNGNIVRQLAEQIEFGAQRVNITFTIHDKKIVQADLTIGTMTIKIRED